MARSTTSKLIAISLFLLAVVGGAIYINRPASNASVQVTDDAYIQADITTVAPQVSGNIEAIHIKEHEAVLAGDELARIDDRDFRVAVAAGRAQVDGAKANMHGLKSRLELQQTAIRQALAVLTADQASLKLAKANLLRYSSLASDGSGTVQALQQADAQVSIQSAAVEKSEAGLLAARQQVSVIQADLERANAALSQAQAGLAAAELKLSYARIVAPVGGTIGLRPVRVGAFVQAGTPLVTIVPLDSLYITANYRETQLARVRPGHVVDVEIDALPGEVIRGTVDSLGPASGVSYSAVPAHNATGNFTKIVQRLPVRIRIDAGQPSASSLRVGMSVTTRIHVDQPRG